MAKRLSRAAGSAQGAAAGQARAPRCAPRWLFALACSLLAAAIAATTLGWPLGARAANAHEEVPPQGTPATTGPARPAKECSASQCEGSAALWQVKCRRKQCEGCQHCVRSP
mmetsp:Transcript_90598/g.282110  ORF Transcript_90598/g.282110 Transcript_90598/m.282110 type:complete len:112 (+) Transcript_90598:24-359(+)